MEGITRKIDFCEGWAITPVNALGYLRVMFTVHKLDETLKNLDRFGAVLVGEVVQYKETYRLCYIRGPEGMLIGLAEE